MEAILAAASGGDETPQGNGAEEAGGAGGAVDPAKRAKALAKKLKKLEAAKSKKEAGETINAVSGWFSLVGGTKLGGG